MNAKRMVLIAVAAVVLVVGGFFAGWLVTGSGMAQVLRPLGLSGEEPAQGGSGRGEVIVLDDGSGPVQITFADPPELPGEPPDVLGLFLRRQDNSLVLGTGAIEVNVEVVNGDASLSANNDGPEVEVVVTGETVIYEDITESPIIGPEEAEKGEMVVQREVKQVDNLDNLDENMVVRVWGEKRGDRVIATLLVYDRVGLQ